MSLQTPISSLAAAVTQLKKTSDEQSVAAAIFHVLYLIVRIIPGLLVWLAGFAAWTLPAWLFKTTSWTMTFTMNATTLYVGHLNVGRLLTYVQNTHRSRGGLDH